MSKVISDVIALLYSCAEELELLGHIMSREAMLDPCSGGVLYLKAPLGFWMHSLCVVRIE